MRELTRDQEKEDGHDDRLYQKNSFARPSKPSDSQGNKSHRWLMGWGTGEERLKEKSLMD